MDNLREFLDSQDTTRTASDILSLCLHNYLLTRKFHCKPGALNDTTFTHDKSSLEFTFKVVSLSPTQILFAAAASQDTGKSTSITLNPTDYLCQKYVFESSTNHIDAIESPACLAAFYDQMRALVEGVAPGLDKDSSQPPPTTNQRGTSQPGPSFFQPPTIPLGSHQLQYIPPLNPLGQRIGDRDLDPFSASPALIDPRFAFVGGGGMVVGPDHPMFQGGVWPEYPEQGIPFASIPPGARFGPRPAFPGGRGMRGRGRGGSGYYGGEPDFDEYIPQGGFGGNDDMFM